MANDTQPRMGIWFNLAQGARFIFWLIMIGVLVLALIGRRDVTQQTRDS
ncbi:MAG: hypothetical protein JWN94_1884, partial [Betaproteobacteria bacterium]|nr:hypothetical protein [Betaproteobacteria bacterium]